MHDSAGQTVAALLMNATQLTATNGRHQEQLRLLADNEAMLRNLNNELRTISYLLHPPLLDEAGFGSAARWYVEGFAQRSAITVNLDLPQELMRLHPDVELALFRAVQECLTNIHKHAGSSMVDIRMAQDAKQVRLEITDNGKGIPKDQLRRLLGGTTELGVGIAGMRERFRELGGSLEIVSSHKGTTIIVTAPLPQPSAIGSGKDGKSKRISAA